MILASAGGSGVDQEEGKWATLIKLNLTGD
jgi:hypothetical protein